MRISNRLPELLTGTGMRASAVLRTHPRIAGAAVSALAGTVALLVRRRSPAIPALPDPTALAVATATAVHNAAKASVIASVVDDDPQSSDLLLEAVRVAIGEASSSGVDVTSAALGAVEGSIVVAGRLGLAQIEVARMSAREAHTAAAGVGIVAAERVASVLSPLLQERS